MGINTHTRVYLHSFNNNPIHVYLRVHIHTYVADNPFPYGKISRTAFIRMSWQKHVITCLEVICYYWCWCSMLSDLITP